MTVLPAGTEVDYTVTWLEMTACPLYPWPTLPSGPHRPRCCMRTETTPLVLPRAL